MYSRAKKKLHDESDDDGLGDVGVIRVNEFTVCVSVFLATGAVTVAIVVAFALSTSGGRVTLATSCV